jgi:hypothetical protein
MPKVRHCRADNVLVAAMLIGRSVVLATSVQATFQAFLKRELRANDCPTLAAQGRASLKTQADVIPL